MIYYSFFSSIGYHICPEKSYIVKTILDNCYQDQINNTDVIIATDNIPVRFQPNLLSIEEIKQVHPNSKIIIFLVDIPYLTYVQYNLDKLYFVDEVWSTEPDIVKFCCAHNLNARLVELKHTPQLQLPNNNLNVNIDVLLYGSLELYNIFLLKHLVDQNLSVFHTDNFEILNKALPRAKIVLNLTYADDFYQEQTKVRYLISNNKCVVSNTSNLNHFPSALERTYHEIVPLVSWLLEENRWKNYTN